MLWVPWHHLQLHQEHPSPPRLQEETWWRIGGVLMRFLMLDLDETLIKASYRYYEYPDTISSSIIKSIHVNQDSRKMLHLDETFIEILHGYFEYPDTISSSIKNIPVFQDSRKRLGGFVVSWWGSSCWIFMKLSVEFHMDILSTLTPSPTLSRTSMPSQTPERGYVEFW